MERRTKRVTPDQAYDVIEIAKLQSAITGILAGFALTVIVLLVERGEGRSRSSEGHAAWRLAAVAVFITMLFTTVLASLLYSINGAEIENSSRAFLLSVPPAFAFALSVLLLMYGIVLLIGAFDLDYVFDLVKSILWVVIALTLFYFTFTTGDVVAVVYKVPPAEIWNRAETGVSLIGATILLPIIALMKRRIGEEYSVRIPSQGFNRLMLACVLLSSIASVPVRFLTHAPIDVFVPFWQILLFIVAHSFLVAWLILFIPTARPLAEESM
jgi:hypothetical protein